MKKSLLKYIYSLVFFISFSVISFAQDDIDDHPADEDPVGAAFDIKLLMILMMVGIAFAFYIINKRKAAQLHK